MKGMENFNKVIIVATLQRIPTLYLTSLNKGTSGFQAAFSLPAWKKIPN